MVTQGRCEEGVLTAIRRVADDLHVYQVAAVNVELILLGVPL
jgi:hypothetical protein